MSGKLNEIIESGQAPGIVTGTPSVDPNSVYAKVPKALAEVERGERRSKKGVSAGEIARHFGMSVDFIKQTWSKPVPLSIILALFWQCYSASAGDLTRGANFFDGQTVSAAQLQQLVDNATINTSFLTGKPIDSSPLASDYLLLYSPTLLGYYKVTSGTLFNTVWQIQVQSATAGTPGMPDLFPFFSASNTNLLNTTLSNLIQVVSSNENMAVWQFAPTNPASANAPSQVLASAGPAFAGNTNANGGNEFSLLTWGTNGVPKRVAIGRLETTFAGDLGTNLSVPYIYNQLFQPWVAIANGTNIYGTNSGGAPLFTNSWGATTNFPITSLFLTNAFNPTNGTQTISNQDTIPIYASGQKTNTTVTLDAIYQYLTNRNTLPPYTVARIQFSGFPASFTITSNNLSANVITNIGATNFQSPTAVSFLFTGGSVSQLPTTPQVTSNQVYYALWLPTFTNCIQLYTNYASAVAQSGPITFTGNVSATQPTMYVMTNYTSVNADVIQLANGTSIYTAAYKVFFRTNSVDSLYYINGTASQNYGQDGDSTVVVGMPAFPRTTSSFGIATTGNAGRVNTTLVYVQIMPQ